MDYTRTSKFISLVLRHKPQEIGISLDEHGWADVSELLEKMNVYGHPIDIETLKEIVRTDAKQRYSFSDDGTLIRANQGHSIPVDVELAEKEPPEILYHGTAKRFAESISAEGLKPMNRLYVHLSKDIETAEKVGKRHGKPYIFTVKSGEMFRAGYKFYLSVNGVWLTKAAPTEYLSVETQTERIR